MKAIILAAGFGTRLLPLTKYRHKALFPIVNKTVIDIIINNLQVAGITSLGLNLHYLAPQIKDYLDKNYVNFDLEYRHEKIIMDTGGGLAQFVDFVGKDNFFIAHTCDVLTTINLKDAINYHKKNNPLLTLVLVDLPGKNNIAVDKNNNVIGIYKKTGARPEMKIRMLYGSGIFIYSSRIFNYLPNTGKPYPVLPAIIKAVQNSPGSVKAYVPPKPYYWRDIGDVSSYLDAHRDILKNNLVLFKGIEKGKDGIWISPNAEVSPDANFKGFVSICENAIINNGAMLENCVVWENAEIKENIIYKDKVIPSTVD